MTSKLYVGNLPFATTAQELQELFSQAGAVATVDLIFDKFTGRSRGFAFVSMANAADAQKAVEQFNGFDMGGRALTVNEARPKEERPPRGFENVVERRGFSGDRERGAPARSRNERSFRR